MILPQFEYEAPRTIEDAVALLARAGADARVLAGGTDLLVKMKRGGLAARLVVSLGRVAGLAHVEPGDGGGLRVGALATMAHLANHRLLVGPWTGLAEGAASVGGPIVRNRATVGGNIVTARPCADTVPPLMALGARLRLQAEGATRTLDLDGFVTGPGETLIKPGEVLTAIEVPAPASPHAGSCYLKITRRAAMEVTIVGCAASVELDEARGSVTRARLVFASVAPFSLRIGEAERVLEGHVPDDATVRAAAAVAARAARPIDDCRAPAWFRTEMVELTARRALGLALERAGWRTAS